MELNIKHTNTKYSEAEFNGLVDYLSKAIAIKHNACDKYVASYKCDDGYVYSWSSPMGAKMRDFKAYAVSGLIEQILTGDHPVSIKTSSTKTKK